MWLDAALALPNDADSPDRCRALSCQALLASMLADPDTQQLIDESLSVAARTGDAKSFGRSLLVGASFLLNTQIWDEALPTLESAITVAKAAGDSWCLVHALTLLGIAQADSGDPASVEP